MKDKNKAYYTGTRDEVIAIEVKSGDFIFRLSDARGNPLANSSSYRTRSSCESAMESTKRWSATEVIEIAKE